MLDELSEPFDKTTSHKAALATEKYATSKFDLFKAVFNREWLLMKRNSVVTIFKCIQVPHLSLSPTKYDDSTPFPEANFVDLRHDKSTQIFLPLIHLPLLLISYPLWSLSS